MLGGRLRPTQADTRKSGERPEVVVVGIGASAGGLPALKTFFRNVAYDSGLAFVVVVHLSPEHESHLAELLQPHVAMPVIQVSETQPLRPNCVFVIPPNANLDAIDTHLRLSPLEELRRERAPIDHFFRTLADTHDGHAIGVILSGTGSDGTLGLREIKAGGGLTVAQDPAEAGYDGMPQSAIASGFVDLVLPAASIPGAVTQFAHTEPRLPPADDGVLLEAEHQLLLQKLFAQIRARTGRDFSRYKRSTILRRLQRRMQLRHLQEFPQYVEHLRQNAEEARALADDLLITVTSFFRDREVFEALAEKVIPQIYEGKGEDAEVRIWCVGCATGEEAYSLAMLCLEQTGERQGNAPRLHVFATDLHERSLELAREGFYPGDVTAELGPERLRRYFSQEAGGYRIRKEVREKVVFAPHNLLTDPPFSRIDLVVCRNLLIYLQREVQGEVLRLFHYALKPGGHLLLGSSEVADDAEMFRPVDRRRALYRRGIATTREPRMPAFPIARREFREVDEPAGEEAPQRYEAMHAAMVAKFSPPSIVVGPDGQVVHVSEQAGRFLAHPAGRLTSSAARLVRKELSLELVGALHAARREQHVIRTNPVQVGFNGESHAVSLVVRPAAEPNNRGYCLVVFEELAAEIAPQKDDATGPGNQRVNRLSSELELTRQRLQSMLEQFETSQEEMKATNEELQSTNEELRSTMEELETSKEELESMNEELQTVNQEYRLKVEELAQLSSDLQNLLTSTDIATLFLDRQMRILRFTPKVSELFNVRVTDRGRPVADLTHRLGYPELMKDAETVLRRLTEIERELQDEAGRWYLTHLLPYRTTDDRIEGVVITFVDITRRKSAEAEILKLTRTLEQRVVERTCQVRTLTTSLVRAEQSERRKLAETLHDELQQLLYGAQLKLQLARDESAAGRHAEASEHLGEAESLLGRSTTLTRGLSVDLNPPILRNEGMRSILDWLRVKMRELHGLEVAVDAPREIRVEDPDVRVLMFQVARELLFNVAKHSGEKAADVSLKANDSEYVLRISDRGKGFDVASVLEPDRAGLSLGLTRVGERVELLGGKVEIESHPGSGTAVAVRVPMAAHIST